MTGFLLSLYICTAAGSAAPACAWNTHPQVYATRAECQAEGEAMKARSVTVIGEPTSVVGHYRCKAIKY